MSAGIFFPFGLFSFDPNPETEIHGFFRDLGLTGTGTTIYDEVW